MRRFILILTILLCLISGAYATNTRYDAMLRADSYIDLNTGWSKSKLIQQLQYEGFSYEDAYNAVETIAIDWNKQAYKKLVSYQSLQFLTRSQLWDQLEYEGFSTAQISWAFDESEGRHTEAYYKQKEKESKQKWEYYKLRVEQWNIDKILEQAKIVLNEYITDNSLIISKLNESELDSLNAIFDEIIDFFEVPNENKTGLKKYVINQRSILENTLIRKTKNLIRKYQSDDLTDDKEKQLILNFLETEKYPQYYLDFIIRSI